MKKSDICVLSQRAVNKLRKKPLFRFTNSQEIHQNFKYKIGLNTDILPLNTFGNCCSGGLYFYEGTPLESFKHSDYLNAVYFRSVTLPPDETVVKNDYKYRAHRIIVGPRVRLVDYVLEHREEFRSVPLEKVQNLFIRTYGMQRGSKHFINKFVPEIRLPELMQDATLYAHIIRREPVATTLSFRSLMQVISKPGVRPYIERSLKAGAVVIDMWGGNVTLIAAADPALFTKMINNTQDGPYISTGNDWIQACLANIEIFKTIHKKFPEKAKEILSTIKHYNIVPRNAVKRLEKVVNG